MMQSISEYLETLNEDGRNAVTALIDFMEQAAPSLHPKLSFSMPMWLFAQKMKDGYLGISAAAKHYSVHFSNEMFIQQLQQEMPHLKFGKRCINIPYHDLSANEMIKQKIILFFTTKRTTLITARKRGLRFSRSPLFSIILPSCMLDIISWVLAHLPEVQLMH